MSHTTNQLVAIIGRPNVGKSTIFNRLVGERKAILSDKPGTTRDILIGNVEWQRHKFTLADTAGIEPDDNSPLAEDILKQTTIAIGSSDLILFVVNAIEGLHPDDIMAADMIRKSHKPVILLINKTDAKESRAYVDDFHRLGFKTTFQTAGTSGKGLGDALDEITTQLKAFPVPDTSSNANDPELIRVAIVGRPNAGKSTLFNRLLGKERSITSNIAGTTRDAINETLDHGDYRFEFIDTAGLRRRGKVELGIEKVSALKVVRSIQSADICLLLMEADEGVIAQDMHIMQLILEFHKSPIIVINKWDLLEKTHTITAEYDNYLRQKYKFATWVPLIYISALTGQRVEKIKDLVVKTWQTRHFEFPPRELNQIVVKAVAAKPLKGRKSSPQIFEAKQIDVNPPIVQLRTNKSSEIHPSHLRFIENTIRKSWAMVGTPIVLTLRGVSRPGKKK